MGISFSGLASGLDTSSWVESLVALKKAKVETYEEEKTKVQTTQETLSKIKSFFTSFRTMLEKVTDAKFGVGSMDIFAQKLANSSDASILTAAATTEAEEASYDITVDKLATGTQAVSGFKNLTTIIQSATATMDTKLSAIGVKAGDIGVTVNGTKHTVTIGENDTISNFITKMKNIGVDASYSEASGVFSINLPSGAIDDTLTKHADGSVGTGIVEALHLKSTGGYESSDLKLTNSETIVAAATGGTKLSELGTIKSGNIQVKANNTSYNIAIDGNTTLASLINNLQSKGIEAKLTNDGVFQIKDAEIVDVGNTGIITALGLQMDVNSKTQTATGLKTVFITTTESAATGSTKISQLGTIKNGNVQVKANGSTYTIAIDQNTTLSGLVSALTSKGVDASLSSDGVFTIKNAEIVDVGNTGLVSALGLTTNVSSKTQTSSALKTVKTITTEAAATGSTKISQLGTIKNGAIQVKANGSTYTITIDQNTTLSSFVSALTGKGVDASLSSDGTITIKDAEIVDSGNTGILSALGLKSSVNSKTLTSTSLKNVTVTTNVTSATGSTKISQLGTIKNGNVQVKANGSTYTIAIDQNTTLSGLVSTLTSKGVDASLSSEGVFTIKNAEIVDVGNTGLVSALGLTTNVSSKTQTSSALKTVKTITTEAAATGSTKISQLGAVKNGAIQVKANDATYTYTIDQNTTLSGLMNFLAGKGVTATLDSDGNFSIANAEIIDSGNTGIISALGLTKNVDSKSQTSGALSVKTVISNKTTASGSTLIKNLVGGSSLKNNDTIVVQNDNDKITTITLQTTSTLDNLVTALNNAGLSAALSSGGEFSIDKGKIIGGSFDIMKALGLNTVQTVSVNATSATKLSNITSERVFSVKNTDGNVVKNVTLGATATIGDLFTKLSENGISASISNGVITLNSTNGNYITGALPKALGIDVQVDGTRTITTGSTATSGEPVHYETQVAGTTTVTTSTSTTSSDRLTYSTVISNSTTSTVANDITSSGTIYYTTVVSSASGGITSTPDTGTSATLVSSSAVIVTHVTSATNSTGDIKSGQAEIVVTNPLLLSNAISTYNTIGIGDAATLAQLATLVNKGISCAGKTIVLTADIDLSGYKSGSGWTPIGNGYINSNAETGVFSGTFDGNGHTISNLYIEVGQNGESRTKGVGLFGYVYAGTIKNVGLKNESVTGKNNEFRYGGLVGVTKDATINNCYTTGSVSAQIEEGSGDKDAYAGGLIGSSENTIINNSYSATNVTATNATQDSVFSGGLVAYGSKITINNCYSVGNVSASNTYTSSYVNNIHSGGLVAYGLDITINNCYSAGNISTSIACTYSGYSIYYTAGGLVGYSNKVNIYNGFVLGKVDRYATSNKANAGDINIGAVIGGIWTTNSSDISRITSVYYNNANSSDISHEGGYIKVRDTYAIEKSSFNQDFYKSIGYDESNGWIYPSSSSSPAQASFYYLNSNTTLKDLLGDSCSAQTVIVQNSSGLQTVVINKTDAIMKKLSDAGLDVSVSDGILTVKGDVISISQGLSDALKLKNSSSDSGNNGGSGSDGSTETKTTMSVAITSGSQNLKLTEIGLTKTNYITVKNGNTTATVTLTTTSTVADLISGLAGVGISTDITNGKITFSGDDTHYILGMTTNLKSALNLVESGGKGYTIQTVQTSSTQTVTLTSADTSIKLGALGLTGTNFITVQNGNTTATVIVDTTSTLTDMTNALAQYGISTNISDGKITLRGDNSQYIVGISSNLASALKLASGNGKTYTTTVTSTNTTQTLTVSGSNSTVKLSAIGATKTNYITVKNGTTTTVITLATNSTIANMTSALTAAGIDVDVTNGIFTFTGDNTHYILGMSANLANILNFGAGTGGGYVTTVENTYSNTNSNVLKNDSYNSGKTTLYTETTTTQTVGATRDTQLSSLGVTAGEFYIYKDGVKNLAVVSSDETLGSFLDKLSAMGIQAGLINNGTSSSLILNAQGDTYIAASGASGASNILTKLFNGQTAKGNVSYQGKENVKSTSTQTVAADRSGLLSAYGVTAGELYVYQNGERHTVQISSDETIGSLIDTLAGYGLKAELVKNGNSSKIVVSGSGDSYIAKSNNASGASNIVDKLFGGSSAVVNESSYTGVESITTRVTATIGATESTALSSLGVTAGEYYIYNNGVKYTALISSEETLGSFMNTLKSFGIQTGLINNGGNANLILIGSGDSYIAKSSASGASNVLEKLFGSNTSKVSYSYEGNESVKSTSTQTVAADRSGLLSAYGVTAGELYVYQNGERHTVQISSDETIGSLIDTLAGYGLKAELVKNGNSSKIVVSGSGDSYIAKSNNASGASNIVDKLFGGSSAVVNESSYTGVESITTRVTATIGATESTALSSLGVTAGEYYIYNNGVKYTALISSEETLGSFMNTLKSFGIQTGLINNGNATNLLLIGSGNSYIAKSNSVSNASNVVEKLFGASGASTSYSYTGSELLYSTVTHTTTATTDSLLSEFDTPWGGATLKSAGDLVVMVNGETKTVRITETETFGSLVDKLKGAGIQADFLNGKLYITNAGDMSVIADRTTSALFNPNSNLKLTSKSVLNGFLSSTATVQSTTTIVEEHSASASAYADMNTKLSTLGITSGSLSVYRNGEKALINVESSHTLGDIRSLISQKFSNVDMKFDDNGKLVFYSTDKDVSVELGNTTDTSNFLAVTGVVKTKDGTAESARALYTVNGDSKVMADGIFRRGKVTAGTFVVGTERIEINANTTINDLVSMINNAAGTNATAYWDTIDGKLVIKSRSSGAALINIEAGTSNFTDIMGYTTSEWNADGSLKVSRMNVDTQELGSNAQFRINGTSYTATSNTITSDITRIKGVTLNLNGLTSGSAIKVTVEKDKESVATALSDIVDSYNELMSNVDEAIAKEGALKNQTTLKMIRNQLRSLMTSSDLGATTFRNLSAIGISVEAASASNISTSNSSIISLNFDKDKFFKAYEADADAVKALLIGGKDNKGIFTNVETLVDNALQSVSGYFAITESAYNRELTNWNTKITKANKEIDRYKSRLEKKFSSMDLTISQMQQQYSSFLS